MKRIEINEDVCIGCGLCEVHCITQNSKSKDIVKAYKREIPRTKSRIRVEREIPTSFSVQCQNCQDAPCIIACLSGAMFRDEKTNLVKHNPDKCIGCWTCIMVCPYGAITIDSKKNDVIAKCDLCPDLEIPACVANCPNEALKLVEALR